jgi:putative heme-binding domain-containing protein
MMALRPRFLTLAASVVWLAGLALRAASPAGEIIYSRQPHVADRRADDLQRPTLEEIFDTQNKQEAAGSPEAGRPIFEKLCSGCHRFGEAIGKDVGPDLTTIASRFKRRDVLESILWPSKVISDQYKSEMFEIAGGTVLTGVIVREDATRVFLRTPESPERPVPIAKAQIVTRSESPVSLMPPGLLEGYSQGDISNLLAFVMSPPPTK